MKAEEARLAGRRTGRGAGRLPGRLGGRRVQSVLQPFVVVLRDEHRVIPASCDYEATVDLVEHLGHETIVHFEVGGRPAVTRLGPEVRPSRGQRLRLGARPGKWHIFEAGGKGRRLS